MKLKEKFKHFLIGASRIFNLFSTQIEFDNSDPEVIDTEALISDWEAVFNDFGKSEKIILIRDYIESLKNANIHDPSEFRFLLNIGTDIFNISNKDIINKFDISKSTLRRWKIGLSNPNLMIRKLIYNWLIEVAENYLKINQL